MENQNKMTPQEIDDLTKSLSVLGMEQDEINDYIQKAIGEKESPTEGTIEEKAKKPGEPDGDEGAEKKVEKNTMGEEDLEKACSALKAKKAEIEKSIEDMEEKMGKKKEPIEKSLAADIEKSFGERFDDIEKALTTKFDEQFDGINVIVKSLQDEVKKIGDTPFGIKSVLQAGSVKFVPNGTESAQPGELKELSISNDRDELLKGMQDEFEKADTQEAREMLADGISDYTVNAVPTTHGIRALAYLSRKQNISLGQ